MSYKKIKRKGFILVYVLIILGFCLLLQTILIKISLDLSRNYEIKGKEIQHYKIN